MVHCCCRQCQHHPSLHCCHITFNLTCVDGNQLSSLPCHTYSLPLPLAHPDLLLYSQPDLSLYPCQSLHLLLFLASAQSIAGVVIEPSLISPAVVLSAGYPPVIPSTAEWPMSLSDPAVISFASEPQLSAGYPPVLSPTARCAAGYSPVISGLLSTPRGQSGTPITPHRGGVAEAEAAIEGVFLTPRSRPHFSRQPSRPSDLVTQSAVDGLVALSSATQRVRNHPQITCR